MQRSWFLLKDQVQTMIKNVITCTAGVTSYISNQFKHSEQWFILSAYTIDGFIIQEILKDSFTVQSFENFIEKLPMWLYLLIISLLCILDTPFSFWILPLLEISLHYQPEIIRYISRLNRGQKESFEMFLIVLNTVSSFLNVFKHLTSCSAFVGLTLVSRWKYSTSL